MGKGGVGNDIGEGVGGFMNSATGGDKVAKQGQNIANAQRGAAETGYALVKNIVNPATAAYQRSMNSATKSAVSQMKSATAAGITSLDRDIANQEKNLARQEQLISNLDPAIIEASQQALKLMRGEESSTLAPLKNQRAQQRQKLLNSLREQLGPGAETSTAGIQAITRFDSETDNLFANAQQGALSNLGSLSAQFTSQRPDMLREISGLSGFGQQQYGLRTNQAQNSYNLYSALAGGNLNASNQRAGMLSAAYAPIAGTAGYQYTGNLLNAQNSQAHLNALHESGMAVGQTWATMGMGGGSAPKVDSPKGEAYGSGTQSGGERNGGGGPFQAISGMLGG